jgi:AraC family transcriptional regulator, transcriptional activator of pobA
MIHQPDIRDIHFFNPQRADVECEVLTLSSLFSRKLDHSLEQPQRMHFYLIILFTRGTGTHYVDFSPYAYDPQTILFVSRGQVQKFVVNPDADGFLLLFTSSFLYHNATTQHILRSLQVFDYALHTPKIALQPAQHAELLTQIQSIAEEYRQPADPLTEEILRTQLRLFLLYIERIRRASQQSLAAHAYYQDFVAFRDLVEQELSRSRTVQYFARQLGVSPRQLNKLTKQVLNKSAKAFIDERVLLEAQRLLAQSTLSIKQIAYHLGFDEPTNFVKFFKKHARCNPGAFRKQLSARSQASA